MLVYGDPKRSEDPRGKLAAIRRGVKRWLEVAPGIARHACLVELLVEAGELEQGLLDAQLARLGEERPSALGRAAARLTHVISTLLPPSFTSRGLAPVDPGRIAEALAELLSFELPETITTTVPEGYAFYGLYPETYLRAAEKAFRGAGDGPLRVVGIRSIGTGLAAVVAAVAEAMGRERGCIGRDAGTGERVRAISVRPAGHPFARRLTVSSELEQELLRADGGRPPRYAVVDEGPGLSGSSFGSVADWLEERGVAPAALSFFPSHAGPPGPRASERHRRRWERARRHAVAFEDLVAAPGAAWPLEQWVADLTGETVAPLVDLGAGRWRERHFPDPAKRPAVDVRSEQRKYLLATAGGQWLLKFAGLGRYGREKLALAGALEGLIPPVAGLRHGFLVSPWLEDALPLTLAAVGRRELLAAVARYLGRRAGLRVPAGERGATPAELYEMLAHNAGLSLGAAASVEAWRRRLLELARLARPVLTDNRMQAWEWLVTPAGEILKADALDHHRGNDLVGPQDIAWDFAGAAEELEPTDQEIAGLARDLSVTPLQLAFYRLAYLAFQLGRDTLAATALESTDPAEAAGLRARGAARAERLRTLLAYR